MVRFWGNLPSGLTPFSNGSVTGSSAKASVDFPSKLVPASNATPPWSTERRSIIVNLPRDTFPREQLRHGSSNYSRFIRLGRSINRKSSGPTFVVQEPRRILQELYRKNYIAERLYRLRHQLGVQVRL